MRFLQTVKLIKCYLLSAVLIQSKQELVSPYNFHLLYCIFDIHKYIDIYIKVIFTTQNCKA